MTFLSLAIATACGVGYIPVAPGTFGSAAGLLLWWILPASAAVQAAAIVVLMVAGSMAGSAAERNGGGGHKNKIPENAEKPSPVELAHRCQSCFYLGW